MSRARGAQPLATALADRYRLERELGACRTGAAQPCWSPDGRELFYLNGTGRVVAAQIRSAPASRSPSCGPKFDASGFVTDPFHQSYEVLPGGRGLVFLRQRQSAQTATTPRSFRWRTSSPICGPG